MYPACWVRRRGASGRHGDARAAHLVTQATLEGRFVRQARAPPHDGCGHAVHRLAEIPQLALEHAGWLGDGRPEGLFFGQHRPGPGASLAASAMVATLA
jgi:hypothetical protein